MKPTLVSAVAVILAQAAPGNPNVHVTYHWHQHQPIYWPEYNNGTHSPGTNRYQFAYDSIRLKQTDTGNYYPGSTGEHPLNQLWDGDGGAYDAVFSKNDRIQAYQHGMRDSIATMAAHWNAGASISYSGALQENIGSLGRADYGGYTPSWNAPTAEARGWTTTSGNPKADLLGMTYHHAFSPLLPDAVLRKEIAIFREIWWKSWSGNPDKSDHSKGFWPVECAFSPAMIPVLREFGYEWSIVANSHLARTCRNYLDVCPTPSTSTWNNVPPNRADRLGPTVPAGQWWSGTIDGRGGTFPAPFAYQAHRAEYIDPETGAAESLIVVPMCDQLSYQNGFGSMDTGEIDSHISPFATDPDHPAIVLMAHDGDNAWGGGNSYYFESVPNLMNAIASNGYQPSTVGHYLASFDHANLDTVHVEDGSWVNADDRGSPAFYHWLFPPQTDRSSAAYDPDNPKTWADFETPGFSEDFRSWAVVTAGANYLETAEALWTADGGTVEAWKIQEPTQSGGTDNNPNIVEQAWHFFLGGLDSGFLYYGSSLDDEMKPSLAQRRALEVDHGSGSLKSYVDTRASTETTPPTIFKPQRWPWNPGGMDWGNHVGYRPIGFNGVDPWDSEFTVWSHIHDVSGVQSATLKVRVDNDGVNSMSSTDNETYAGGSEVGQWIDIPMTHRTIDPTYNPDANPGDNPSDPGDINFFIQPAAIADYYFAKVTDTTIPGIRNQLVDYYIEATDTNGNTRKSGIQHVYVEDDGSGGNNGSPPATPANLFAAADGTTAAILAWNAGSGATEYVLRQGGQVIATTTDTSYQVSGLTPGATYCWTVASRNADGDSAETTPSCVTLANDTAPAFTMDGVADSEGYLLSSPGMTLYAALRGNTLYVATWNPEPANGNDHFILIGGSALEAAASPAPWAKSGLTALPETGPFLAAESDGDFIGWFNAGTAATATARGGAGQQIEGTIDIAAAFGSLPGDLFLSACAWQTADAGILAAQAPTGNSDANLDPNELYQIPLEALRDDNANGTYDRLDPASGFKITSITRNDADEVTLRWQSFPAATYHIETSETLTGGWTKVANSETTAGPTDLTTTKTLTTQATDNQFYRIALTN